MCLPLHIISCHVSISVALCVGGVCFISFFPSNEKAALEGEQIIHPSPLGYIFCFLSMVLYALYEVLYKKWAVHHKDPYPVGNAVRFLGLVGVSTAIFCAPPLLIIDATGMEQFMIPAREAMPAVFLLGFLDTLFNVLLLICIGLSSPLFTSVGCLLVLPVSIFWDQIANDYHLPAPAMLGVGLIALGFVGFGISEATAEDENAEGESYAPVRAAEFPHSPKHRKHKHRKANAVANKDSPRSRHRHTKLPTEDNETSSGSKETYKQSESSHELRVSPQGKLSGGMIEDI
eukprot:Platyproteum_vivax@DN5172_c0_g1_i1.p1